MEKEENENRKENSRTALDGKLRVYCECPSTVVVSENVFCQGMVVLLNPVCNWLSEMLHVYKSEVRVAVLTAKTLASIQRLKIVGLFGPLCLKLNNFVQISCNV